MSRGESYASVHREAVRESLRTELARALAEIDRATWVGMQFDVIYTYGSRSEVENFAKGLGKAFKVREITDRDRAKLAKDKRAAYRNP